MPAYDLEATATTPLLRRSSTDSSARSKRVRRRHRPRRPGPPIYTYPAIFSLFLFALATIAAWDISVGKCKIPGLCRVLGGIQEPLEKVWMRNAGPYAPYMSRGHGGGAAGLPKGCKVDQVSILHRHTGRYPTQDAGDRTRLVLKKLANRRIRNVRSEYSWLGTADFELQDWDMGQLTKQGRRAAWDSGRTYAERYASLFHHDGIFARSSRQQRVVETSEFWLQAFHGHPFDGPVRVPPNVVIAEGEDRNNTLSVHSCPRFNALSPPAGEKEKREIARLLDPAVTRLNGIFQPNPPFDVDDIGRLADLCGFDSQASGESWKGWSHWCRLLRRDEWEVAGYVADVARWYRVGEGSRFGKIMGAGWVNELLARLTDTAPVDQTTTNHTLDDDPATFPPGGKRIFVDFTHDNEMIEILTAMGIRKMRRKLPIRHLPDDERRFILSELIPFGARWAVERIECDESDHDHQQPVTVLAGEHPGADGDTSQNGTTTTSTYVRLLINDHPAHIDHMACRSSAHYSHYLCELDAFIESQAWATDDVDWDDCRLRK